MRKIFSLIFVCILLAPTAAWWFDLDFGIQVERLGLQPPRLYGRAVFDNQYYLSFEQYFNDSFSLRSPLIFAKRFLDYRVFHMTEATGVHLGTDGWLYGRRSIQDYRKKACSDRTAVGQLALELQALERIIEASGRRFIFIVAPNKSTIYPEFVGIVPDGASCNRSRYDLLLEILPANRLKSFVRLDERLKEAKKSHALLYDRASTYWNGLGAMVAAETIHRLIFGDRRQDRVLDYKSDGDVGPGDLNRRLLGFLPTAESEPVSHFLGSGQPGFHSGVVYGDDFIQNLLPYMIEMFSRLDVIRTDSVPSKQFGEDLQAYDFILLEIAESELGTVNIEIDKIFSTFEAEAKIPVRYALDLQTVAGVSQISLGVGAKGLEVKSVGAQSVFKFISMPASDDNIFRVLKLSIEAPHSDVMTFKFVNGPSYTTSKFLKLGLTQVYLPLPFQKTLSLHIQPGNLAGVIRLRSAEILEFPDRSDMVEPSREKTIVAAVNPNTAGAFSPAESEAVLTESEPDPDISNASLEAAIADINSERVVSGDSGRSASNKSFNIAADAANLGNLQAGSAEPMTQPEADSGISAPIKTDRDSGTNSEKVASETVEMLGSRKLASGVTVPNHVVTPQTKESKVSADISKSESDNSIATPRLANGEVARENAASKNAAVPISKAPAIAVTDFEDGRIFQRKGLSADIVVSGTYTGLLEAIEARVVRDSTFEEIVPWTVIESSPRNGIFVGILPDVPQGGWYNIHVRSTQDHSVSTRGAHKWGVGMLVACLGQSNMKEWFYTGTSLSAHALLRKFSGSGWSAPGRRGNAAIAFGNRIIDRLGIPVGLLDYSVNGSGLRKEADWGTGYWEDTAAGSIYNRFITGLTAVGGALESVIWIQGEADAARGTVTEDEYRTSLTSFITNQLRTDIHNGSDRESLPFLLVMMIKRPGGKDEPHQAIRNAQKHVAENVKNCYLAATTLDLKNQGRQHLTSDAYMILGRRVAQTVLYILGLETYYRGPTVADVKRLDNRIIDIVIQHRGGTDFTPMSGITGWEVLTNGSPVPITEVHRRDSQTIRIFLKDPLAEKAKILYLYGAMPDSTRPVLDNSAMRLPLEECQSEIN